MHQPPTVSMWIQVVKDFLIKQRSVGSIVPSVDYFGCQWLLHSVINHSWEAQVLPIVGRGIAVGEESDAHSWRDALGIRSGVRFT